jgi:flagellar basal-body rod protein FlgF
MFSFPSDLARVLKAYVAHGSAAMNNTLLIAASRQIALKRSLDVIANNVANITTTGFKRRSSDFAEYMMPVARGDALATRDKALSFVTSGEGLLDTSAGAIERTGNPLDIAMRGNAFLAVQTPEGERYTRNGSLSLDATGQLVTMDGQPALSEQGPLQFTPADGAISISTDGTVSTAQGVRGKLKFVTFTKPHALESIGRNLLKSSEAPAPAGPENRIEAGALERANVSSVSEVAKLVEVSRAYSSVAQIMQRTDELRRSAVSRLADMN